MLSVHWHFREKTRLIDLRGPLLHVFVCQRDANIPHTQPLAVQTIAVKATLGFA